MPIHLPPINRRTFLLQAALLAAAGCQSSRPSAGSPGNSDPNTWALLSDTHIAADPASINREVRMAGHLEQVAAEVIASSGRPAGAIINGDCAYLKGEPGDYDTLTTLLRPMREAGLPVWCTLGNHDERQNFRAALKPTASDPTAPADRHLTIIETPRANLFLLDSLEVTNQTPGLLGEAQLQWLGRALDARAKKPAVVFGHHQMEPGEVKSGLRDSKALLELLESRRQVKLYVYGHTHTWKTDQTEGGLHLVNLPPVAYVFEKGRPSGWVLAKLNPGGARLELHNVDPAHPQHGQTTELRWRTS